MFRLKVVNEHFPKFSTFVIQFGRKFATADVHKHLFVDFEYSENRPSGGLSFVGVGGRNLNYIHLLYLHTPWYLENKEYVTKACVLRHEVRHFFGV